MWCFLLHYLTFIEGVLGVGALWQSWCFVKFPLSGFSVKLYAGEGMTVCNGNGMLMTYMITGTN